MVTMADLTLRELADLLGITQSAAQRLANERLLVRSARGRFDLEASVRTYTAHLRSVASNRSESDSARAAIRQKIALAELAEVKALELRGKLIDLADHLELLKSTTRLWKAAFAGLPQRFRVRMRLTVQQEQQMEALVDERLDELEEETLKIKASWDTEPEKPSTTRIRLNKREVINECRDN